MKNMYSEELEALISAALADGAVSDKERQVLIKRAVAEGVDPDEFELVLDSRIILAEKKKTTSQKTNKMGEIRKCPSCGSPVSSFQTKCSYCGHEFLGVAPNPFVQQFADGLRKVTFDASKSVHMSGYMKFFDTTGQEEETRKEIAMCNAENMYVRSHPLPLAKEDIIEMLTFMLPKIKASGANATTLTWRKKYEAVLSKLEVIAVRDKDLLPLVDYYRSQLKIGFFGRFFIGWKALSRTARVLIWLVLFYVVFFSVIGVLLATYL
jgi:hypothetical protein